MSTGRRGAPPAAEAVAAEAAAPLADADARRAALLDLHRTLLVEAGAGSGKTSLMAGRVVMLLVAGVPPREIAAITFTTLAAADLSARIRGFVDRLLADDVPPELAGVLPSGLDRDARALLDRARADLDELTSTTIHGFCQDLVRPYPVEADVDPGARVLDEREAALLFDDVRERWLRERLGPEGDPDGPIARMVAVDAGAALRLVGDTIDVIRASPGARAPRGADLRGAYDAFVRAARRVEEAAGVDAPPEAQPFAAGAATLRGALGRHGDDASALALAALTLPRTHLHTQKGPYRVYGTLTAWKRHDRRHGAERHAAGAAALSDLEEAEAALRDAAACAALAAVMGELEDLRERFQVAKRRAALLDFDDLLVHAERLLRQHPDVRRTLARRFRHVLVDEFQDTDPLQARIVWSLCCDDTARDAVAAAWPPLRPGSLFVVGDPKQSIYRFRGADVDAYRAARAAIERGDGGGVLTVTTNFRSTSGVLDYANARFAAPLAAAAQPGFQPLDAARKGHDDRPRVVRLTVRPEPEVEPRAADRRDLEAEAVAAAVAGLLHAERLPSRGGGPCRAGDVALLAPTTSELWRYERALEDRGIAVASQAGKGFYGRQEVQDLIALVRTLADERDTLALGALLRGPVVGCTDEELLDVAERLRGAGGDGRLRRTTAPELVGDERVEATLRTLQELHELALRTTPAATLHEAVARLRIRAVLEARHPGAADRAVANLERFLEEAGPFAGRGLAAFARTVRRRWREGEGAVEGRADRADDAVTLITVHSSKGLEWPVVIPINTFGPTPRRDPPVLDRRDGTLHARVLGARSAALGGALAAEAEAEANERVRLLYVAATRAQDLLIVPAPGFAVEDGWWCRVVDLATDDLPELDLPDRPHSGDEAEAAGAPPRGSGTGDPMPSAERFAAERARLAAARGLHWGPPPSRLPGDEEPPVEPPPPQAEGAEDRVDAVAWPVPAPLARGRVLHALMHEALAGTLPDDAEAVADRARTLLARLGLAGTVEAGLRPDRLAAEVVRALALPEIASRRGRLLSEVPVYGLAAGVGGDEATAGIADAVAFDDAAGAELVVDWKSDADPAPERVARYEAQLRRYLALLEAPAGLIVFLATGRVRRVAPEP